MIEVNKPLDTTPNVRCYKCKTTFYVHPHANMNAPYVTNCELHKPKCNHNKKGINAIGGWKLYKCNVCGELYR
jgi:hypothetical protein